MNILAIESSCDESAAAVYGDQGLCADEVYSQQVHQAFGGVVPELASREHVRMLLPVVERALSGSGLALGQIDAIAVTQGPGLAGALLVGLGLAHGLALALDKPVWAVHHLEAHVLSPLLARPDWAFPYLSLLVSGGHTELVVVSGPGQYQLLGQSVDDAAGEAFDKSAQLLGLGYPGGAALSAYAAEASSAALKLPRPMLHEGLDFSFSGLKTALALAVPQHRSPQQARALALSLVEAVVEVLLHKTFKALEQTGLKRVAIGGGVSANAQLRQSLAQRAEQAGVEVCLPPLKHCTDNAAMVALAAYLLAQAGRSRRSSFVPQPRWSWQELGER